MSQYPARRKLVVGSNFPPKWSVKACLRKLIPTTTRSALRRVVWYLLDLLGWMGRRDRLVPPRSKIFVGDGDFEKIGEEFRGYFIELGGLRPSDRILDIGCGIGRMAIPLTSYMSRAGEYWGFDIVKPGIEWCQQNISSRFENFRFQYIDVHNKNYNPRGERRASDFRFPFENQSFDFVFLTSVFTHMLSSDMANYLSEISRVLKGDARCLATFFLLNSESRALVASGRSTLDFRVEIGDCLTTDENNPEAAIAYDEDVVRQLFAGRRLKIMAPIRYGSWCNRNTFLSYQDIVIARKENLEQETPASRDLV